MFSHVSTSLGKRWRYPRFTVTPISSRLFYQPLTSPAKQGRFDAHLVYGDGRFPGLPAMYIFLKSHKVKTFYNGVNNAHSFFLRYTSQFPLNSDACLRSDFR